MKVSRNMQKIADMLLLNGTLLESSGLWYGKMGVAIFFFHYARYTGNGLYEDYAVEIIRAVQTDIHRDSPADYGRGLAGIGAGIEYAAQKGFLGIDTDEVLEDFDNVIRKEIMYRPQEDNSLNRGLCGLGSYLLWRVSFAQSAEDNVRLLTNREMLVHVVNIMENEGMPKAGDLPDVLSFLSRLHVADICNPKIDRYLDRILKEPLPDDISDGYLSARTLALLRIASIRDQMVNSASLSLGKVLQTTERATSLSVDTTDMLLWLIRYRRLIVQSGICVEWLDRLEIAIQKELSQAEDLLRFEKNKFSLKGCAGAGMSLITAAAGSDDTWLDLLG